MVSLHPHILFFNTGLIAPLSSRLSLSLLYNEHAAFVKIKKGQKALDVFIALNADKLRVLSLIHFWSVVKVEEKKES